MTGKLLEDTKLKLEDNSLQLSAAAAATGSKQHSSSRQNSIHRQIIIKTVKQTNQSTVGGRGVYGGRGVWGGVGGWGLGGYENSNGIWLGWLPESLASLRGHQRQSEG